MCTYGPRHQSLPRGVPCASTWCLLPRIKAIDVCLGVQGSGNTRIVFPSLPRLIVMAEVDHVEKVEKLDMSRRNRKPRLLTEPERQRLDEFGDAIHYSSR